MSKMDLTKGEWQFDTITEEFDKHIQESIPKYQDVQKQVSELLYWFLPKGEQIVDLGSSTGAVFANNKQLFSKRNIKYLGLDVSEKMIHYCQNKYREDGIRFQLADITEFNFPKSNVFTSLFTLQFLTREERKQTIKNIYDALKTGGAFIITEKVLGETPYTEDIFDNLYQDFKSVNLPPEHLLEKKQSLRGVMFPITLNENLQLLKDEGFTVDIFFKWNNFVGILALKM